MGMFVHRYNTGLHVEKSCETALSYYRSVADRVHLEALAGGGEIIERVRLADEKKRKRIKSQAHILQYYQLNARQGSVDSQVTCSDRCINDVILGTKYVCVVCSQTEI